MQSHGFIGAPTDVIMTYVRCSIPAASGGGAAGFAAGSGDQLAPVLEAGVRAIYLAPPQRSVTGRNIDLVVRD